MAALRRCLLVATSLCLSLCFGAGCRKQELVPAFASRPYPTCGSVVPSEGQLLASGHLRAGPFMHERDVVEFFEVRRRDCLYAIVMRQEWPLGVADVEALFDANWQPLRVWKRMTLPGTRQGEPDIKLYELAAPRVRFIELTPRAERIYRQLRRPGRPAAVLGPGRGLLTAWLQRAQLDVGQKQRVQLFDFRGLEQLVPATLRRDPDRYEPSLRREVRVYTVLGRESIFADEHDIVIGDLAGLRPHASLADEPPPPMPRYGSIDPVHTP